MSNDPVNTQAADRQVITDFLGTRSLGNDHRRLAERLEPGMLVLDVGCGPGAITRGIAEAVGHEGSVIGIDAQESDIERAKASHADVSNLSFETEDIYTMEFRSKFDIVTASRVLQWLNDPRLALVQMADNLKSGGLLLVLDYNHEKIEWKPDPPQSMLHFYRTFLDWRAGLGLDNTTADRLAEIYSAQGLKEINVHPQHEATDRSQTDFQARLAVWLAVAEGWGKKMVLDGAIEESDRLLAITDYRRWMQRKAQSQKLYLQSVEARLASGP